MGCSSALPAASAPPTLAFAATETDVTPDCSPEGMPQVVATHVRPMAGVSAETDGARVWLRFATGDDPHSALSLDPASLQIEDGAGLAPRSFAAAPTAIDAKHISRGPTAVGIEGGRQLVAWTEGSAYDGMHVRMITLAAAGTSLGAQIDLGYEGSAIGRPAIAVTSSGRGVVAFEESSGSGFHLVVVRVSCRDRS